MLYYDVGKCPRCGSPLTGRLVPRNTDAMRFSLTGPVIYDPDPGEYNCACAECGVFWTGLPKLKNISLDEYDRLGDLWDKNVDGSPTFTKKEEREIALGLYEEETGEVVKPEKNRVVAAASKVISHESKSLKKQGGNLVGDFLGIFGIKKPDSEPDEFADFTGYEDVTDNSAEEGPFENPTYLE